MVSFTKRLRYCKGRVSGKCQTSPNAVKRSIEPKENSRIIHIHIKTEHTCSASRASRNIVSPRPNISRSIPSILGHEMRLDARYNNIHIPVLSALYVASTELYT